jgi:hypothetical protein
VVQVVEHLPNKCEALRKRERERESFALVFYTCIYLNLINLTPSEWKSETCWKYSRNRRRGIKESDGGGKFNYDIL